jgi:hypothetical protein
MQTWVQHYYAYRGPLLQGLLVAGTGVWIGVPAAVMVAYALHTGCLFEIEFGDGTTLTRRPSRAWRSVK